MAAASADIIDSDLTTPDMTGTWGVEGEIFLECQEGHATQLGIPSVFFSALTRLESGDSSNSQFRIKMRSSVEDKSTRFQARSTTLPLAFPLLCHRRESPFAQSPCFGLTQIQVYDIA